MSKRFKIVVDGKWQGGSFATAPEAATVAERLRKSADQKIEVKSKGGVKAEPEPEFDSSTSKRK